VRWSRSTGYREAKGSSQAPNATGRGMPEPIKTGADQIQGVVVEKLRRVKAKERWTLSARKAGP
jgi:hypothetical protein